MKFQKTILVLVLATGWLFLAGQGAMADVLKAKIEAMVKTADAYGNQGNFVAAMRLYEQAIRMRPGDLGIYYQRGLMLGRAGHYSSAIKDFSLIIQRDESSPRRRFPSARKYRAEGFVGLGQLHRATEDYKAQLRQGGAGKIWFYLAETYALMKRNDLALDAINRGLATDSHWRDKLMRLQMQILTGETITPHKPFSN